MDGTYMCHYQTALAGIVARFCACITCVFATVVPQ